jgi:hypothetical protein
MPINVRQVDNVDTLPPASNVREIPPWQSSPTRLIDWRGLGVLCLFFLLACPLGWFIVGRDIREWVSYGWGGKAIAAVFALGFVYAALLAVRHLLIIEQPGGFKVAIWNAHAPNVVGELISVHDTFAGTAYRGVAAQTISYPSKVELPAPAEPPQITDSGPTLVPDAQWLEWIDQTPHLMIAGRTNAGKTTMAEAVIARCASQGELLYVLDPHYQPGKWCGLPAVGGGRGYGEVMDALGLVLAEMDTRYKDFDRGKKTDEFDRLNVFIDEVPAIVEWCFDGKKLRDPRWMSFAKQLGSEARKVGIRAILMTQSPLVQDIQINSRMRNNFTRIALGDQSSELIKEDSERRYQLAALIKGQRFTAAMEYDNIMYVFDTANVPSLARRSAGNARPWQPAPQIAQQMPARAVVSASAQTDRPSGTVRASVAVPSVTAPQTDRQTAKLTPDRKKALIAAMRANGRTRKEARGILAAMGEGLDNDDWTEVK